MVRDVEIRLFDFYPYRVASSILKSLKDLVKLTDFSTHRKSIAFFVSSTVAKLYYLNIEVEENISIADSFDIRDIIKNKSRDKKYLLLTIDNGTEILFLGKNETIIPIVTTKCRRECFNLHPEKPDPDFIRDIDHGLNIILEAYPLPLVLACNEATGIELSETLKNYSGIAGFLPVDYEKEAIRFSEHVVPVFLDNWNTIREADLLLRIERSIRWQTCFLGISDVYKAVNQKKGNLLIIEKKYTHPAISDANADYSLQDQSIFEKNVFIPDLVDILIERVLDNGGDVEFMEEKLPSRYSQIVLI